MPLSAGSEAAAQRAGVAGQLLPNSPLSRAQQKAPRATCFTHVIDALAAKPGFMAKPSTARTALASESRASLEQTLASPARLISSAHAGTSQSSGTTATSNSMAQGTAAELSMQPGSHSRESQAEVSQHRLHHRQSSSVTQRKLISESCLATANPSRSDGMPQSDAEACLDNSANTAGLKQSQDTSTSSSRLDAYRIVLRPETPETKHSKGMQQL